MLKSFHNYIQKNKLFANDDKILVTVSGGVDSVVLLHLLHKLNYNIALAHCNFNLRGNESDQDEHFVKSLCNSYGLANHFISFNTEEFAAEKKISIEMAARDLRYNWFNELCQKHNYTKIATGHHLNDSIETLFINLTRGTGINGLTGINPMNGNIVRPLSFASRDQIEAFAAYEKLEFRTDSSNHSNAYVRNIIRNEIIPRFKTINPSFEKTMRDNLSRLNQTADIYNQQIDLIRTHILTEENNQIKINIKKLNEIKQRETYLYELISPYNFNYSSVINIISATENEPGRLFYSPTHQILVDRENIIIEIRNNQKSNFIINAPTDFLSAPIPLKIKEYSISEYKLIKDKTTACLDTEKLNYPLTLRIWEQGDFFYPLGMNKRKKISDFFIDEKINRFEKLKTYILTNNEEIIWVVGHRIDNRYKITPNTKSIIQLTLQ